MPAGGRTFLLTRSLTTGVSCRIAPASTSGPSGIIFGTERRVQVEAVPSDKICIGEFMISGTWGEARHHRAKGICQEVDLCFTTSLRKIRFSQNLKDDIAIRTNSSMWAVLISGSRKDASTQPRVLRSPGVIPLGPRSAQICRDNCPPYLIPTPAESSWDALVQRLVSRNYFERAKPLFDVKTVDPLKGVVSKCMSVTGRITKTRQSCWITTWCR